MRCTYGARMPSVFAPSYWHQQSSVCANPLLVALICWLALQTCLAVRLMILWPLWTTIGVEHLWCRHGLHLAVRTAIAVVTCGCVLQPTIMLHAICPKPQRAADTQMHVAAKS